MKLFLLLILKRKALFILTICMAVLTAIILLWWNVLISRIVDTISAGYMPSTIALAWAATAILVMGISNYISGYTSGYTCESITHDLRMGYARYFAKLPFAESEKLNAGEQLSKLQNEISDVSGYLTSNFSPLLADVIRFFMAFTWLHVINPTLNLAVNLPSFATMAYVIWSSKIIGQATNQSQQAKGQMNQYADTLIMLFPIIRLYDGLRMVSKGYINAVEVWKNHTVKAERTRARLMSLSAILSSVPLLLIFLIGGRMTIDGALSIGTLYMFINLSGNVSGVLMNMPRSIAALRQFSANMNRLSEVNI